jgi:2-oxoglutarate dehydrogenase E1 component
MDNLTAFHGPNAGYVLDLYERFQRDPESVDPQTRALFARWAPAELIDTPAPPAVPQEDRTTPRDVERVTRVSTLAQKIRGRGHLAAQLDPLGRPQPGDPSLDPAGSGVTEEDLRELPASAVGGPRARNAPNAGAAISALYQIYCATTGYDFGHIQVPEERAWLRDAVESGRYNQPLDADSKRRLLQRLTEVEAFERFLHRSQPGQKRFSIEGNDTLVPMLDTVIVHAAMDGTGEVVMGMAHRGRLNVLAQVLGKPFAKILAEFHAGAHGPATAPTEHFAHYGWTGDVKYHLGARKTLEDGETARVQITLAPNPSHLEFVDPVIQGMARAHQEDRAHPGLPTQDVEKALAILIHGDASFPGEGVVAESLNLSRLAGYRIGGTVHIIVNNQLGFTTGPEDARSTLYASDLAKGFEIPIVHVNADDPEACVAAAWLAYAYRARFHKDFLIDLVGYRRWGHNEGDEPAFTQPLLYEAIRRHPTVRALYAQTLEREGVVPAAEAEEFMEAAIKRLQAIDPAREDEQAQDEPGREGAQAVETAVPAERLRAYNEALLVRPPGFAPHPKLERVLQARRGALEGEGEIDWGHAEALAFASLLADGTPIRLIGQDAERGTFSQRNLVLHDAQTGALYIPLHHLQEARASFAVYNSPLSEAAPLGFEYGYSGQAPNTLVLWEAQYGDFANAAQVIIDQFISAARAKWREQPWLVLLLPHGYEGQGPEHSSARLERYLQLAGDDNLRVANVTSAAQYFHLLRRQVTLRKTDPRPLILMSPKSLLRHPQAASPLAAFAQGCFQPVIDDAFARRRPEAITRLILCTGKVYMDLTGDDARAGADRVAIARLEQLYPFPDGELSAVIEGYPHLREVIWLQEEPKNMGAWSYMAPRLRDLIGRVPRIDYIGRPDRASPAEGSPILHRAEQARIVAEAFSGLQGPPPVVQGVKHHAG